MWTEIVSSFFFNVVYVVCVGVFDRVMKCYLTSDMGLSTPMISCLATLWLAFQQQSIEQKSL